jgi:hypothetical protein
MAIQLKRRSLLKLNMKLFMDYHFLREGGYTSVNSGQLHYTGSDMSVLLPDTDADDLFGLSDGSIWQSAFRGFIYESGVVTDGAASVDPPVLYSGVYIQGTLRGPGDPEFGHFADYINGRIIFNDPQPLDLDVKADFSWRHVRIGFEHDFNQQTTDGYLDSQFASNPLTSMQITYPSGRMQPFPAVFIEVDQRRSEPYELGNRSMITTDTVRFHVWATDDVQRDDIIDVIDQQVRKVLPIINFNRAPLPLSGIYNTLSPEYITYQTLLRNNEVITTVGSGLPIGYYAYIDESNVINMEGAETYERGIVEYEVTTYLNAPTGPLGHLFGPISSLPPAGDIGL